MKGFRQMTEVPGQSVATRRFYRTVSVEGAEGGFGIRLDGRSPRSPGGKALTLPTRALAEMIAEEWAAQSDTINYASMPATRLAHTALDVVARSRRESIEGVTRYAGADLLCYFAEGPGSLVRRQEVSWLPLLEWAQSTHGLALIRAVGILHQEQPAQSLAALIADLEPLDDFTLGGLAFAAALFGSAVLALALRAGRVNAEEAMAAARLDEIFQEERWGVDGEAAARTAAMTREALMAERWFAALKG